MTDETESTEATEAETTVEEPENISDLFDDDKATESETETETESEKGDTEDTGETDDDTAAETKAESEPEPDESSSETPAEEDASVPRRALIDERRKRQELERRLAEVAPADEEAPDPTDDPQAYEQYLRTKWEKEQWEKTANRSREKMLESKPDYEEKEKHFLVLAQQDPDLIKQMNEDPDPASFAYNKAKESLDAQEQAIEQRVLERLKKEGKLKDESKDKSTEAASRVSDLTSATAAGKNSEDDVVESENPEDVFGDELAY